MNLSPETTKELLTFFLGAESSYPSGEPSTNMDRDGIAYPYELGKAYFIRTVTHHHTGRLVAATEKELVLEEAAWIANDGRFADALETGEFNEVEPFPEASRVIVGRGSIIDAVAITTDLPREQK